MNYLDAWKIVNEYIDFYAKKYKKPELSHYYAGLQPHLQSSKKFFAALGIITGDGGKWFRTQCLILARNNHKKPSPS